MKTKLIILPFAPVFSPGLIVATPNALRILNETDISTALARHLAGDWGEQFAQDWQLNEEALKEGDSLHSIYRTAAGTVFWIMTEWDRSCTTILMPSDY